MPNLNTDSGQLSLKSDMPKKRLVSAPRKKKGEAKVSMTFSIAASDAKEIKEIADRMKMSRSHLITKALDRCKHDGIWRKTGKKSRAINKSPLPPPEVAAISNLLLEFGFALETLLNDSENPKSRAHASRIHLDAKVSLAKFRQEMGC